MPTALSTPIISSPTASSTKVSAISLKYARKYAKTVSLNAVFTARTISCILSFSCAMRKFFVRS